MASLLVPVAVAQETPDAPPSPPIGLVALPANNTTVLLLWQPPLDNGGSNVTEYRVYRAEAGNESLGPAFLGPTNETAFVDYNIADGSIVLYEYWVTAVNAAGESEPSNTATASGGGGACVGADLGSVPPAVFIDCTTGVPVTQWPFICTAEFLIMQVSCED